MSNHLLRGTPQAAFEKVIGTGVYRHCPLFRASPLQQVGQRCHFILFTLQ
jgi:hypothetical protein